MSLTYFLVQAVRNKQCEERGVPAPQAYYSYVEDAGFTQRQSNAQIITACK